MHMSDSKKANHCMQYHFSISMH